MGEGQTEEKPTRFFFFSQEGHIPREPQRLDHTYSPYKLFQNGSELKYGNPNEKDRSFSVKLANLN